MTSFGDIEIGEQFTWKRWAEESQSVLTKTKDDVYALPNGAEFYADPETEVRQTA